MSDYKNDKYINLNKLEWECARMPELYSKWGGRWGDAIKERDLAAEKIKLIRSQIIENVRLNWKDLGFDRPPTDQKTEAYYRTQPEYIAAKEDWIIAEANSRKLYIAVRSMEHKKDMLTIEQRLYANEYWSTPYSDYSYQSMVENENKTGISNELNKSDKTKLGKRLIKRN